MLHASSSPSPRIVSILAGGQEGELDPADFDLLAPGAYSIGKAGNTAATMTTLAMEHLAASNPSLTFAQTFPGLVSTGLLNTTIKDLKGFRRVVGTLASWTVVPIIQRFVAMSPEEAGERALFVATSPRYAGISEIPGSADVAGALAPLQSSLPGRSVYRVHSDGETVTDNSILGFYREEKLGEKVWKHTLETFEKITGKAE